MEEATVAYRVQVSSQALINCAQTKLCFFNSTKWPQRANKHHGQGVDRHHRTKQI